MQEHVEKSRSKHVSVGVFAFVVVAVCLTAIFGSGIDFGEGYTTQNFAPESASSRLAGALVELGLDPALDHARLKQMTQTIMDRAAAGDIEAAAFVFELAVRQRAPRHQGEKSESSGRGS